MKAPRQGDVVDAFVGRIQERFDGSVSDLTARRSRSQFLASASRRQVSKIIWAPALALAVAASAVVFLMDFGGAIDVVPQGAALSQNGAFTAVAAGAGLAFSDGSRIDIGPGAAGKLDRVDAHGADIRVTQGRLELSVAKRKQARWAVLAGPYRVRVTGTRFSVDWDPPKQRFSIHMLHGHVLIDGPGLVPPKALGAGDSWQVEMPVEAPKAEALPTRPQVASVEPPLPQTVRAQRIPAAPERSTFWKGLVAKGRYADVLAEVKGAELTRVLARGSLAELAAVADAGRYGRDRAVATKALEAQRARFGKSEQAVLAAYLLGRLAEDAGQPSQAVQWYDRYIKSPGPLPLSEESLGRKMLALERGGKNDEAARVAAQYKKQYPHGSFFDAASRVQSGR